MSIDTILHIISLIVAFGLGAAWMRLYPPEPYIDPKELEKPDYGNIAADLDEEAGIALAQAQHAEQALKERNRQIAEENAEKHYRERSWK